MNVGFLILTIFFIVIATVMILIILMQRPQGGGLAGAFGGAGGSSADTVFGGRVGDALTRITVMIFLAYLGVAISLNMVESRVIAQAPADETAITDPGDGTTGTDAADPATLDLSSLGGDAGANAGADTGTPEGVSPITVPVSGQNVALDELLQTGGGDNTGGGDDKTGGDDTSGGDGGATGGGEDGSNP